MELTMDFYEEKVVVMKFQWIQVLIREPTFTQQIWQCLNNI